MNDQQLEQAISQLRQTQQPARDLWPAIEQALDSAPAAQPSSRRWIAAAAIALLTFAVWKPWQSIQQGPKAALLTDSAAAQIEANYSAQRQALLYSVVDAEQKLSPWSTEIQLLDQAALDIRLSLEVDPDNMALLNMLRRTYQRQLDLVLTLLRSH